MTLTDTGPLVALIDAGDDAFLRCQATLPLLMAPMTTTLPCLTEAMYFLGDRAGSRGQNGLWRLLEDSDLAIAELTPVHLRRARQFMSEYADRGVDFADASLLAIAETSPQTTLFTLDSRLRAVRLADGRFLEILP